MQKQKDSHRQSDSRKRVRTVFEEEEAVSKAFQLDNFYTNQRLNITELKQRLELFKKAKKPQLEEKPQSPTQKLPNPIFNRILPEHIDSEIIHQPQTTKLANSSLFRQDTNSKSTTKYPQNSQDMRLRRHLATENNLIKGSSPERDASVDRREEARQANYRIVRDINNSRYESKTKTAFAVRPNRSATPMDSLALRSRLHSKMKKSRAERSEYSKCSSSLENSWVQLGIQGRVLIHTQEELLVLEKQIISLWDHYQLLTGVLLGLKSEKQQKNSIVKYVDDICSDKFQFVRELLAYIQKENPSRTEASFMKRLKKALIQGKLLENLVMVYVSLEICLQKKADSHLVNFLGYCCSNVAFLLKFVLLCHSLAEPLEFSVNTTRILQVISEFQISSYKTQLQRMGDLVLRVEHNNEVISILHNRICTKMDKHFQRTIIAFLKSTESETEPRLFLQYGHYIFEFLAFHLASSGIVGQFGFVEMAPSPYLELPRQKTLVIEPWEVLFAVRGTNTYIRAYSEAFLSQISKHWNIVYWTDLMPEQIDDLLTKLPQGSVLYRYHCRYENDRFLKLLWRIGCDLDNTIIVDRQEANFKYDREMGVQLPWHGKSKDYRLVEVLNILLPLLTGGGSLKKSFAVAKEQIIGCQRKSRQKKRVVVKGDRKGEGQAMYPRFLFNK